MKRMNQSFFSSCSLLVWVSIATLIFVIGINIMYIKFDPGKTLDRSIRTLNLPRGEDFVEYRPAAHKNFNEMTGTVITRSRSNTHLVTYWNVDGHGSTIVSFRIQEK